MLIIICIGMVILRPLLCSFRMSLCLLELSSLHYPWIPYFSHFRMPMQRRLSVFPCEGCNRYHPKWRQRFWNGNRLWFKWSRGVRWLERNGQRKQPTQGSSHSVLGIRHTLHTGFWALVTSLHFVNNWTVPEMEKRDKLWKLRPWLDSVRERCLKVIPEEHNSVDEMVIPFKGRFIKQYMRYKPRPWGFKLWVRTGISGTLCDFDVYQGGVDGRRVRSELGLPGDVVMRVKTTRSTLTTISPVSHWWSSSLIMVSTMWEQPERYAYPIATFRMKRVWRKRGEESLEGNHNICTVKLYDNRAVTLVSTFVGPDPVQKIQRWDKATRTTVEVERPYIVNCYNKYIRGVDLLD